MDLSNVYFVYRLHPHEADHLHHQLVAKFLLTKDHFEVLEDHTGQFARLATKSPEEIAASIHGLSKSMYYKLVNLEDFQNGKFPELIKEHVGEPTLGPESTFDYHRVGMPEAQKLEFHSGKAYLDGHRLEDQDLQLALDNVQQGHATIRYHDGPSIEKAEEFFMSLAKIEPHLEGALEGLRAAVKAGHVDPRVLKHLTREIFTDSMVKGVGNKKAYADFLTRPKKGVHVNLDLNDFGTINKLHSFEHGNRAITAAGNAIREAMDEAVGRGNGKLFRPGGDEFVAFVPSHEHAALFARTLRDKFEAIPAIGGTHNISASIGFGHDPHSADQAMIEAKKAKKAAGYSMGQAKTHVHSLLPGLEGPIPTGADQLHLKPLPKDPMEVAVQTPHILSPEAQRALPKTKLPDAKA